MESKHRDLLLKGLLGLIASALMVWMGYYLNAYLARDVLSIEYVDILPMQKNLRLPRKPWQSLLRNDAFQYHLSGLTGGERDMIAGDAPVLRPDQKQSMETILNELKDGQGQMLEHIEAFLNLTSGPHKKDIEEIERIESYLYSQGYSVGYLVPRTWEPFSKAIVELQDSLKSTLRATSVLLGAIHSYTPDRTGEIDIQIMLLNAGNTDGLVRPEGRLVLMDSGLAIPIYARTATQIAKHSMAQVSFWIDKNQAPKTAFDRVTARIKAGHAPLVKIELESFQGAVITTRQRITLPVKVEEHAPSPNP